MSDWESFRRFRAEPKRPPPEHGIRIEKAGSTWWGQRWIAALEQVLGAEARRLGRGRSYARAGRTHDLVVSNGTVTARVTGSRPSPYQVRLELRQLAAEQWALAIRGMASKAQFSAELLAGQMPLAIDEAFRAAHASLFPAERAELVTSCTCPDWGDPCKHVAATHYVLGEALDRDPFLLFELRGRRKHEVLEALRAARAGSTGATEPEAAQGAASVPAVTLAVSPGEYDRARVPLPALEFSFDEPRAHGALLRQLGTPPGWGAKESPSALFEGWIRDAADAARRVALAEAWPTEPPEPPEHTARPPRGSRLPAPAPAEETRRAKAAARAAKKKKQRANTPASTAQRVSQQTRGARARRRET